jgi:hypothetical protein
MEGCTLMPSGSQRMAPPDAIVLKSKDQIVRSSSGVSAGGISDAWLLPGDEVGAGSKTKEKTDKVNKVGDRKKRATVQLLRKHTRLVPSLWCMRCCSLSFFLFLPSCFFFF